MNKPETLRNRTSGRVTLAEVAARAGVGTMKVSRVINPPELVSAALRTRIA